jgi:hypothetical protein
MRIEYARISFEDLKNKIIHILVTKYTCIFGNFNLLTQSIVFHFKLTL